MWNRVEAYIQKHGLLKKEGFYIVALSGGADSVALLLIMKQLGYRIEAAHCNFCLRGEESDRDETFVCQFCGEQNIPIHRIHFETKEYASLHKVSIEMAARELRYRYFEQLRQDIGADAVCVAHHCDDAIETLLMNLMNSTGIHGLTGIRPKNGAIVRPLLCLRRKEIEDYLHSIGQSYVTDSTNAVSDVLRNKIRLLLVPLMQQILPKSPENIAKTANYMREVEAVYDDTIRAELSNLVRKLQPHIGSADQREAYAVKIVDLHDLPSPECFLFEWLRPYGFNSSHVLQIAENLDAQSGKTFRSASHVLYFDRDELVIAPQYQPVLSLKIPEDGFYTWQDKIKIRIATTDNIEVSKSDFCVTVDKEKVEFPLTVRVIHSGDRFLPYGMKGTKLVSDYLTDKKISLWAKQSQMVITDNKDDIVWLVGHRIDHRFRITSSTTLVLKMELQ